MNKIIEDLAVLCKEAIESEAAASYTNGDNPTRFNGCSCMVNLKGDAQIEVDCGIGCKHDITIWGKDCPNVEESITKWLDENACEAEKWQDAYDSDPWRGVDVGCDPAFPHHGDFERWAYGC